MTLPARPSQIRSNTFWEKLLPRTLAHCRKQPFYREKWGPLADEPLADIEDLAQLPVLGKDDLRRFFDYACAAGGDLGTVIHSSGTTGQPVYRIRSKAELQFIFRFFSKVYPQQEANEDEPAPLGLVIDVQDHGGSVSLPPGSPGFRISSWSEARLADAIDLLQSEHRLPGLTRRVATLSCGSEILITLTLGLLRRGLDPASFRLRAISIGGLPLTRTRYDWLRRLWNCSIVDRWSCSEVFGSAARLQPDEAFVFDPNVVTELIDPKTGVALAQGTGLIALTELVPFSQMQTLVRYAPGDLFQAVCFEGGSRAFRFRGRTTDSVMAPDGRLVLAAMDILEVLHKIPWVTRWNDADMGECLSWGRAVDPPLYRTRLDGGNRLTLSFATHSDPALFPEAAERTCREIENGLKEASPELADFIAEYELTMHVMLKTVEEMVELHS